MPHVDVHDAVLANSHPTTCSCTMRVLLKSRVVLQRALCLDFYASLRVSEPYLCILAVVDTYGCTSCMTRADLDYQ